MIRIACVVVAGVALAMISSTVAWFNVSDLMMHSDTGAFTLQTTAWMVVVISICVAIFATRVERDTMDRFGALPERRLDTARETAVGLGVWTPTIWLTGRCGATPKYNPFLNELHWPVGLLVALGDNQVSYATTVYCHLARGRKTLCLFWLLTWAGAACMFVSAIYGWFTQSWITAGYLAIAGTTFAGLSRYRRALFERELLRTARDQTPRIAAPSASFVVELDARNVARPEMRHKDVA